MDSEDNFIAREVGRDEFIQMRVREATARAAAIAPTEDAALFATAAAERAARRDAIQTWELFRRAGKSRRVVKKQHA